MRSALRPLAAALVCLALAASATAKNFRMILGSSDVDRVCEAVKRILRRKAP